MSGTGKGRNYLGVVDLRRSSLAKGPNVVLTSPVGENTAGERENFRVERLSYKKE